MDDSARPLKIGMIGAGTIAGIHLRNLAQIDGVQIRAVSSANETRRRAMVDATGAQPYGDARRLLDEAEIDAVFLCVPPFAHADLIERAAGRGLHVFVEKPVALNLDAAMRRAEAIERAGVFSSAGYMWRYAPVVDRLRMLLPGVQTAMLLGRMLNGPNGNSWSLDRSLSGGLLVEFATHIADLLRFVGGEVAQVSGAGAEITVGPAARGADSAVLALQYRSGAIGTLEATWASPDSVWDLQVVAPQARLQVAFLPEQLRGSVYGEAVEFASPALPAIIPYGFSGGPSWFLAAQAFVEAVRRNEPQLIRCTYRDAVGTLALTLAGDEAIRSGQPVRVEQL